jgi:hypothetical protein
MDQHLVHGLGAVFVAGTEGDVSGKIGPSVFACNSKPARITG